MNESIANGLDPNGLDPNGTDVTGSVAVDPRFSAETQLFNLNAAQPLEVILPGDVGVEQPAAPKQGSR